MPSILLVEKNSKTECTYYSNSFPRPSSWSVPILYGYLLYVYVPGRRTGI